jgi:glycosyltransferase involved in cell wall biosynthesis
LKDVPLRGKPVAAIVCDAMYPYSQGGREFRYQGLLPKLAKHVEIHVYTMHWWTGPRVYTEGGVTFHAISPRMSMYTKSGRRSIIHGLVFAICSLSLLTCRFDVLEVDQIPYFHLFPLRLIATIRRKPLVATWHEVWGPSAWHGYLRWVGWLGWLVESFSFRMPDHIFAVSAETSARLHEFIGDRASITMVPNGIDTTVINEVSASPFQVDIVTVGRLIEHKRVHVLLEVIAALHARGVPATCRIIGDGPDRLALQEQAKALGIDAFVEFLYEVSEQKELYALVKASRLFVSLSAREGFGIAILEAIACGAPVLTTSAPDNLAQYLAKRYTQGFVCGTSVSEITDAVERILSQSALDSSSTDPWVAEYSWETMIDLIVNIYGNLGVLVPVAEEEPAAARYPISAEVQDPIVEEELVKEELV